MPRAPVAHGREQAFFSRRLAAVKGPQGRNRQGCGAFVPMVNIAGMRRIVSEPPRSRRVACPRCKAPMEEVVRIAPVGNEPGLIAYECPSCNCVTSVLTTLDHPEGAEAPKRLL